MPWGLDANEQDLIASWSDRIESVTDLVPQPLDLMGLVLRVASFIPIVWRKRHTMMKVRFAR